MTILLTTPHPSASASSSRLFHGWRRKEHGFWPARRITRLPGCDFSRSSDRIVIDTERCSAPRTESGHTLLQRSSLSMTPIPRRQLSKPGSPAGACLRLSESHPESSLSRRAVLWIAPRRLLRRLFEYESWPPRNDSSPSK